MSRLEPLLSNLQIQTKSMDVVPLHLNWCQRKYLEVAEYQLVTQGRIRIIVLKARQVGISTITEALAFLFAFIFPRYRGVVIAHDRDSTEGLLGMTELYWDTCPWHDLYNTKHLSTQHIRWRETASSIKIATAGSKEVGRSKTIHFLHASEYAFWPNPTNTMLGLRQAIPNVPGTVIVLESTANGIGNAFHTTWLEARAGENEYYPLFFPWHEHPEYRASVANIPIRPLGRLNDEERTLRTLGIDDDRLLWRRWAIANNCNNNVEQFHQEYPFNETEAFISTGHNVFAFEDVRKCYVPMVGDRGQLTRRGMEMTFSPREDGSLRVFKYPNTDRSWGQYFVSVDTSLGRKDYSVIQVFNRHTLEQAACYRSRLDPASIAEEAFKIGIWFNSAPITVEKGERSGGGLVIGKLLGMGYPYVWKHAKIDMTPGLEAGDTYGWTTGPQTKSVAVGYLAKCFIDGTVTIHDEITYQECKNYTQYENGEMGPADEQNGHDDTTMALAIGLTCHFMSPPVLPYGSSTYDSADGETGDDSPSGTAANALDSYGVGAGQTQLLWDEDFNYAEP